MKESEDRQEKGTEETEEGMEGRKNRSNPLSRFCDLGNKIFSLLDAIAKFKKIGLLDTTLIELDYTFKYETRDSKKITFRNNYKEMVITSSDNHEFLENFKNLIND